MTYWNNISAMELHTNGRTSRRKDIGGYQNRPNLSKYETCRFNEVWQQQGKSQEKSPAFCLCPIPTNHTKETTAAG